MHYISNQIAIIEGDVPVQFYERQPAAGSADMPQQTITHNAIDRGDKIAGFSST
jgi:hypothetical protein